MNFNTNAGLETFSDEFALQVIMPPQNTNSVRYQKNRNRSCYCIILIVFILMIILIWLGYSYKSHWKKKCNSINFQVYFHFLFKDEEIIISRYSLYYELIIAIIWIKNLKLNLAYFHRNGNQLFWVFSDGNITRSVIECYSLLLKAKYSKAKKIVRIQYQENGSKKLYFLCVSYVKFISFFFPWHWVLALSVRQSFSMENGFCNAHSKTKILHLDTLYLHQIIVLCSTLNGCTFTCGPTGV